jgi:hypothetical protein
MTNRLLPILVTCDRCCVRPGTISDPWSGELLCDICEEQQREDAWMAQQGAEAGAVNAIRIGLEVATEIRKLRKGDKP